MKSKAHIVKLKREFTYEILQNLRNPNKSVKKGMNDKGKKGSHLAVLQLQDAIYEPYQRQTNDHADVKVRAPAINDFGSWLYRATESTLYEGANFTALEANVHLISSQFMGDSNRGKTAPRKRRNIGQDLGLLSEHY